MEELKRSVRKKYAELAVGRRRGEKESCCGESPGRVSDLARGSYEGERGEVPEELVGGSLGCGNPVALAELSPGEVVLDLGSGGGLDVLLSARRVLPGGRVYGLDMTDEMLDLARENARKAGVENAEFLEGEIERVPLPDASVDVVLSNCVINLSTDKPRAIAEAYRVLKPGGRLAVSDVVFLRNRDALPRPVREAVELWTGCISGALGRDEYASLLAEAGFEEVSVEVVSTYEPESIEGLDTQEMREALGRVPVASASVRATKPEAR
ncbi:Methyltransferase domain (plasmid) [Rubrobacter radiotolerans]|uniref:Arsenite methyltransferase n=1 Tax=Rubrobacter radiotolerans TaxID=42256 RepID=A0A023X7U1_RUBRA|nr:arsenite methyltransferase [Rubrobacter radiotolerans]AHY48286.1 Methyltransferase domain [Rubrobacter radiotolerans]MDX5895559.1 arsenite methyltransferase [Rubrobacter radiotolerans]SMC01483.1 Methyltransferase domain-containing protein [Rubrobacter radiotolerans DSM 5868]